MQLKYVKILCQAKTNIQYETTKTRPAATGGATVHLTKLPSLHFSQLFHLSSNELLGFLLMTTGRLLM